MNAKKKFDHSHDLVLLPFGGTGEIGMNCYAYGADGGAARRWLLVDLGVKFGSEREPGVDVILPDIGFLIANRDRLEGLVITHAHEDHIGAVPWLWPQLQCPVWCTPFAAELLKLKLKEHGLDGEVPVHVMDQKAHFKAGPFKLEFVPVTHSIPESCALVIETTGGRIVHSGDWKWDKTPLMGRGMDEKRFRELGEAGVDVLVCDSTNVLREGFSPSEREVAATLADIVREAPARVVVTTFASQVERIYSAVKAARAAGREVVIAGRAMRNTIEAARATGFLKDAGAFLDEEEAGYLPPDRVLILCTGSQGEPRAAIARIAEGSHPHIELNRGDLVVFSSKTIPGNEVEVAAVHNNLALIDIDVLTSDDALVHSSGHPRQGELQALYDWLKPRALVPMHGEPRHLRAHARFAEAQGIGETLIPKDGTIMRLCPAPLQVVDEAPVGRLHVDGQLIVAGSEGSAKQRRKLSFVGIIVAVLVLTEKGELADDIQIVTDGVPPGLEDELLEAAETAFDSLPRPRRKDVNQVAETLRMSIRRAAEQVWGKKPVVKVIVSTV